MEILFAQSGQDCGSSAVSLYCGKRKLAEVGIGSSEKVELEEGGCQLAVVCGTYRIDVNVDGPCTLEVSWSTARGSMIVSINNRVVGERTI